MKTNFYIFNFSCNKTLRVRGADNIRLLHFPCSFKTALATPIRGHCVLRACASLEGHCVLVLVRRLISFLALGLFPFLASIEAAAPIIRGGMGAQSD